MKIKEVVVESMYDWFTKLSQHGKQAAWASGGAAKWYADQKNKARGDLAQQQARQQANQASIPNPEEGTVLQVTAANGLQYFKSYTGSWHQKGTNPNDFSVGGTKVTNPAETSVLDNLLSKAKKIAVKPDKTDRTGNAWVYDERRTKLLQKRKK